MRRLVRLPAALIVLIPALLYAQEAMSPDDWLIRANQQYQSGDNDAARTSALKVLDIGQKRSNPDWIGGALAMLCRISLADGDSDTLRKYTAELQALIDATGDQRWAPTVVEMNAALAGM